MKKLLISTLVLSTIFSNVASAQVISNNLNVTINGTPYVTPNGEQKPYINQDNRTMVPIRFISNALGVPDSSIQWDNSTQTATISASKKIKITVGKHDLTVDGQNVSMDTATENTQDRVFIPARFIAEALGATVNWDSATNTVNITDPNASKSALNVDQWGSLIRTTNLPTNASDYPYILSNVPNEMYQMKYPWSPDNNGRVSSELFNNDPGITKANLDKWVEQVDGYYNIALNVDYNTIDNNFTKIFDYMDHMVSYRGMQENMNQYISWVKQNQIKLEGSITPEPSMLYDNGSGIYYIRSKIHVKIDSCKENKDIFFNDIYYNYHKLEVGKWYTIYADISLGSSVAADWTIQAQNMGVSVPSLFNGSLVKPN